MLFIALLIEDQVPNTGVGDDKQVEHYGDHDKQDDRPSNWAEHARRQR